MGVGILRGPYLKIQKLPNFHFMFSDRYEIHIQGFEEFFTGSSSFPVQAFKCSKLQIFKISRYQHFKISKFQISAYHIFRIPNFKLSVLKYPKFKISKCQHSLSFKKSKSKSWYTELPFFRISDSHI